LPTGDNLKQYWLQQLDKAPREILTVLLELNRVASKQEVADATESHYSARSSSFHNALSKLRRLGLLEGRGDELRVGQHLVEA